MHPRDLQQAPTRLRRQLQQLSTRLADSTIIQAGRISTPLVNWGYRFINIGNFDKSFETMKIRVDDRW